MDAAIRAAAKRANEGEPAFVTTKVSAYDAQDNAIDGSDRDKASVWRAEFTWANGHQLTVDLSRLAADGGDEKENCQTVPRLGVMDTCEVTDEPDDSITVTEVQPVRFDGSYWVWVMPGDTPSPSRLAYERTVTNIRPDGLQVSATERVTAGSLEAAASAWVVGVADLRAIALDRSLEFPAPPPVTPTGSELSCDLPDSFVESAAEGGIDPEEVCQVRALREKRGAQIRDDPDGELSLYIEGTATALERANTCDARGIESGEGREADRLYCVVHKQIASGALRPTSTCGPPECPEPGTPVWHYTEPEIRRIAAGATG